MAMTSHHLLEPTPWEIDMEHLLLTSTWQHTNQVREFVGQKHTVFMHAYTWFVLVMGFT